MGEARNMTPQLIRSLFRGDVNRKIEEVIKVDQDDPQVIRDEIDEYVVTSAIAKHFADIFEVYGETPNKPHEGIAVWVSGFFGSGKSSFAKNLGLAIQNRTIVGESAAKRFTSRSNDKRLGVLLKTINEKLPTHAVIFDVSTDRGINSNQTLTQIMYGLLLHSLGYAKDMDLAELEIGLEEAGRLARFEAAYASVYAKDWNAEKGKVAFALSQASRIMHDLEPATYPLADSWVKAVKSKADISPGKLAERANELMRRRKAGHALLFVADEVGQFVARDVSKMLDLQAIVQNLGTKGRGRLWLVVTSQEKLGEVVSGLDDKKIELARLMDRFPQQVHLEPSDISEVTSRRVLSKSAAAEAALGSMFDEFRARLTEHTRVSADVRLPELSRDAFVALYPLLPYQVPLVIDVVSGLRTQGGASRHVGGANRTIIKLAQQLLIGPAVNLAARPVGELARLDHVYDLVENNIGSEIRAKIGAISKQGVHDMAQSVAKAICLLQFVRSVHRTPENIAAVLHPSVSADSQLVVVKEALAALEAAHLVRRGDDGYRIPTPAEDDWERTRARIDAKPGDVHRLHGEVIAGMWEPQPAHTLLETKTFKAGLALHGKEITAGDLMFHLHLAADTKQFNTLSEELRTRSQQERKSVFWAISIDETIDRATVELHRSREMLSSKEREAKTPDENALVGEEKHRQRRHLDDLRRLLKSACLAGSVYFRGNDRSPGGNAVDVGRSASEILGNVLPQVFDRFKEASAKASDMKKGLEALLTADNLQGLPSVFTSLGLLRDEKGKTIFRTDSGPLAEVLNKITERANYGESADGRLLSAEFAKEPFGWEFEAVRLLVLALLRAGIIDATTKGQTIASAVSREAHETFTNNNCFRQASFRPRKGIEFPELVKAAEGFRDTFGADVKELNPGTIASEIRDASGKHLPAIESARQVLLDHRLPGAASLDAALGHLRAIQRGSDDVTISEFNASHRVIKEAIVRAGELDHSLTETSLADIARAQRVLTQSWPFLSVEPDAPDDLRMRARTLADALGRETFFRELPSIDQNAHAIEKEYTRRYAVALDARVAAFEVALEKLSHADGWTTLGGDTQSRIAAPLTAGSTRPTQPLSIPQLRAELEACDSRLRLAIQEVRRIVDGERVATVDLGRYFGSGIETQEQLDSAIEGIHDECAKLIVAGKKIVLR